MQYTPNHHLPQWVKSDRIMMDDFNQMCRNIEDGLNKTASSTEMTHVNTVISAAQTEQNRIERLLEDVARDNYRQTVQQRAYHNRLAGLSDSLWVNSLSSRAETGDYWNGAYGIRLGGPLATVKGIEKSAEMLSFISTMPTASYKSRTAAVTFTSDGYGVMESIYFYTYANENFWAIDTNFMIFLTRTDTGELVAQAGPFSTESEVGQNHFYARQVNFPLAPGVAYKLEVSLPDDADKFQTTTYFHLACTSFTDNSIPTVTIVDSAKQFNRSDTITAPSWAHKGIGILRWAGSGSVALSINGKQLQASRTRNCTIGDNASCMEVEYPLSLVPAGAMTIAVSANRGAGDLHLCDYGMIWL